MTSRKVPADWAWISKDPGGIDAGILATSGRPDLRDFVARYAIGTPSSENVHGAPDAPPWVTFAPFAGGELASVSVRDPSQEQDHTNRRIWPQRFFLFQFADLAGANASFQTVWDAVQAESLPPGARSRRAAAVRGSSSRDSAQETLPPDGFDRWEPAAGNAVRPPVGQVSREVALHEGALRDGAPPAGPATLQLSVPEQSLAALIEVIQPEFEVIARLTVAVLEGRVAVNALHLQRDRRLMLLDVVAALLPYGFRADLSASSSVDNRAEHGIRLVFADFANEQELVSLASPPEPRTPLGGDYLAALREKAAEPGLEALVKHLWAYKQPCSFEHPEDALEVLQNLDRGGTVERALAEGRATRDQVVRWLRKEPSTAGDQRSPLRNMPDALRQRALSLVLGRLDADAAEVVVAHWRALADDVRRLILRRLDDGDTALAGWCLAEVSPALSEDAEDQLLAGLIVPQQVAQGKSHHRSAQLELLRSRPVPARDSFPVTCAVLCYGAVDGWQALLVRELLAPLAREVPSGGSAAGTGRQSAVAWVTWLRASRAAQGELPGWVRALGYVLGSGDGERPPPEFRALMLDDVWAVTMLSLARGAGRLRWVLEPAAATLVDLALRITPMAADRPGRSVDGARAVLGVLDVSLWQQRMRPHTVANVDVVRMLLGGKPRDIPSGQPPEACDEYGFGLADTLKHEAVRPWQSRLQDRVLRDAVPGGTLTQVGLWLLTAWSEDLDLAPAMVDHIAALTEDARPNSLDLSETYWEVVSEDPRLKGYASVPWVMSAAREVIHNPAVLRRTVTKSGLSNTKLALACYHARQAGLSVEGIAGAMAGVIRPYDNGAKPAIRPGMLFAVLRELQTLSFHAPQSDGGPDVKDASERELLEFCRLIVRGKFGPNYAATFAHVVAARLQDDIGVREAWLRGLFGRGKRGTGDSKRAKRGAQAPAAAGPEVTTAVPGQQIQEFFQIGGAGSGAAQNLPAARVGPGAPPPDWGGTSAGQSPRAPAESPAAGTDVARRHAEESGPGQHGQPQGGARQRWYRRLVIPGWRTGTGQGQSPPGAGDGRADGEQ